LRLWRGKIVFSWEERKHEPKRKNGFPEISFAQLDWDETLEEGK